MTDQRLRELLDEHVADLSAVDLVDGAWQQARAVRRRRLAVAAAVAGVAVVVGTTAVAVSGGDDGAAPPAISSPSGTTSPGTGPQAVRAGQYDGVPVWWAPSTTDEASLPRWDGAPLPPVIDLSDGRPAWPGGMGAVALLQRWGDEPGAVVVVGEDGRSYSLDVSRLDRVRDGGGNDYPPVREESVSPDGRHAFFAQDGSLEVYSFEDASWTRIQTPPDAAGGAAWSSDGASIRVPRLSYSAPYFDLFSPDGRNVGSTRDTGDIGGPREGDEPYGPSVWSRGASGARGMYLAGPVDGPAGEQRSIEALAIVDGTLSGNPRVPHPLLAFPRNRADDGRWLQCCPAVGWLDNRTVLFESRWADAKILAWRVGTPHLYRVSDIVGWTPGEETYVASFAALD